MSELDNHSQNSNKFTNSFSYKENKSYLKISFERIAFIFFVFFILAIIFSSKVILLSIKKIPEIQKIVKKDLHRVQAIKGFYDVSLNKFDLPSDHRIALAYLDCDYHLII